MRVLRKRHARCGQQRRSLILPSGMGKRNDVRAPGGSAVEFRPLDRQAFPQRNGAIAVAGGNTSRASNPTVLIQHVGEQGLREYPLSPAIPVLPGDLIRVPER